MDSGRRGWGSGAGDRGGPGLGAPGGGTEGAGLGLRWASAAPALSLPFRALPPFAPSAPGSERRWLQPAAGARGGGARRGDRGSPVLGGCVPGRCPAHVAPPSSPARPGFVLGSRSRGCQGRVPRRSCRPPGDTGGAIPFGLWGWGHRGLGCGSLATWGHGSRRDRCIRGGVGGAAGSPRDPRRPPPPPAGGALATPGRLGERVLAPPLPSPRKRESMRMRAAERLVCRDSLLEHTPAFVPSVSLDPGTTPGFAVEYYLSANRGEVPKSVAAQDPPPVLFLQILCFPGHPLPSLRRKARDRSRFFLLLGVYQTREGYADEHGRCLVAGRRACVVLGRTNTSWPDKARLRKA